MAEYFRVNSRIRRILEESGLNELAESSIVSGFWRRNTNLKLALWGLWSDNRRSTRRRNEAACEDPETTRTFCFLSKFTGANGGSESRRKWCRRTGEFHSPAPGASGRSLQVSFYQLPALSLVHSYGFVCFCEGVRKGLFLLVFGFLSFLSLLICCQISQVSNAVILFLIIVFLRGKKKIQVMVWFFFSLLSLPTHLPTCLL